MKYFSSSYSPFRYNPEFNVQMDVKFCSDDVFLTESALSYI